jgi:hypothetical protein
MSATSINATTTAAGAKAVAAVKPVRCRQARPPGGVDLGQGASREARQQAAAILEVLSGARTTAEAAAMLGVSLPRYYQIESRALRGLLAACEAKPRGRQRTAESELAALRQQHARLERELARQQALARMAQRTIGLAAPPAPAKPGKKSRRPKVARALTVAARLQQQEKQDMDKQDTVPAATPEARESG